MSRTSSADDSRYATIGPSEVTARRSGSIRRRADRPRPRTAASTRDRNAPRAGPCRRCRRRRASSPGFIARPSSQIRPSPRAGVEERGEAVLGLRAVVVRRKRRRPRLPVVGRSRQAQVVCQTRTCRSSAASARRAFDRRAAPPTGRRHSWRRSCRRTRPAAAPTSRPAFAPRT